MISLDSVPLLCQDVLLLVSQGCVAAFREAYHCDAATCTERERERDKVTTESETRWTDEGHERICHRHQVLRNSDTATPRANNEHDGAELDLEW